MLKRYVIKTECEALFLASDTDHNEIEKFLLSVPHTISDKGVTIIHPGGEELIEFDKFYLLFDNGSRQLLSIVKDRFEESAIEIKPVQLEETHNEIIH